MPIDPDMEPILQDIRNRIDGLQTQIDNLQTGGADPLVDAWREVGRALEEIQGDLNRDESVAVLLAAAERIRS